MVLAGSFIADAGGRYGAGPVNSADGSGKAWRARNVSGDYAAGEVVLYDASGNALLTRVPADGDAVQRALTVEALLKGYDGTNTQLVRVAHSSSVTVGALASVPHMYEGVDDFRALATAHALTDASLGTNNASMAPWAYNGSTWDRWRNNTEGTLLASAARTATTSSATQTNYNARGVLVTLNVTAGSGTGGLQVQILTIDPVSSNAVYLTAAPTAVTPTGTATYTYELYPGSSTAGSAGSTLVNQRTAGALPRTWLARVTHGDASSYTYSLSFAFIV